MTYHPHIQSFEGKLYVFCDWRKKYVRLTPEEWVRQHVLHYLVEDKGFPFGRVAVEQQIRVEKTVKRCDAVVYDERLRAVCIMEFKADSVPITQAVFDQAAVYNHALKVPLLLISNGKEMICCRVMAKGYEVINDLQWIELLKYQMF